ncbi:molybdenum cofactor sulfurylase [Litoreibacter ponti]|uniref:Molybdenum cofactor sulfurylase n=1 Tax=Litoreibacter ponti TaxID=1510457 RepID=A0A2T6BE47_9RHOB|nr:xanthine dehydrogenase accessory protein XdhC [Litoreibacter ponti]PTX54326.1 molybdenum cofactor sulfurylase [Litoreibacter ponti]
MSFDLDTLRAALDRHGRVARVVIAEHHGSSPRETGTAMLVWDGGQSGTIGGGTLELEAARRALTCPGIRRIPLGPALGQCCGGAVTLVTEVFETLPDTGEVFARRIDGTDEMPLAIRRAMHDARNGNTSDLVFAEGWLAEPVTTAKTPLWIWGAGHVGRALVDVLAPLNRFVITWVDSALDRFPDAAPARALPVAAMPDAAPLAPLDAHHIILTYSHAFDLEICHRLLQHGAASVGLIGSDTKWARFRTRLRALGHSDAQISAIRCPIGQPELGKHPQAIAIGVASELITLSERVSATKHLGMDAAR